MEEKNIIAVENKEVSEKWNGSMWFISRKRREVGEMEVICNTVGIDWLKICSKGKHCFLIMLQSNKEKVRIEKQMTSTLLEWAITVTDTKLEDYEEESNMD